MLQLTLEERGAYNTLLDLIYSRGGPVPDDDRWLAGWMGVSLRRWKTLRAALIVKGKVFALNVNGVDCLMNERAADELASTAERRRNLAESGAKGGRKRAETCAKPARNLAETEGKSNENNAPAQATLEAPLKLITYTDTQTETDGGVVAREASQDDWPEGSAKDHADKLVELSESPWLDPHKSQGLVLSVGRLAAWKREGASWEHDVLPAVLAGTRNRRSPVSSWTYFDRAIAQSIADNRRALEIPRHEPGKIVTLHQNSLGEQLYREKQEARRRVLEGK